MKIFILDFYHPQRFQMDVHFILSSIQR